MSNFQETGLSFCDRFESNNRFRCIFTNLNESNTMHNDDSFPRDRFLLARQRQVVLLYYCRQMSVRDNQLTPGEWLPKYIDEIRYDFGKSQQRIENSPTSRLLLLLLLLEQNANSPSHGFSLFAFSLLFDPAGSILPVLIIGASSGPAHHSARISPRWSDFRFIVRLTRTRRIFAAGPELTRQRASSSSFRLFAHLGPVSCIVRPPQIRFCCSMQTNYVSLRRPEQLRRHLVGTNARCRCWLPHGGGFLDYRAVADGNEDCTFRRAGAGSMRSARLEN